MLFAVRTERARQSVRQEDVLFMRYIDNLLDWGDSLFSQFTMESVHEAEMLYVMASDILGQRPVAPRDLSPQRDLFG